MDEYYNALKFRTSPKEYPYGIILADNNYMIRGILQNIYSLSDVLKSVYQDIPYRFSVFRVLDLDGNAINLSNSMMKSYFQDNSFIRTCDIHPIYNFHIDKVCTAWNIRGSDVREFVKTNSSQNSLYSSTITLNKAHTLVPLSSKVLSKKDPYDLEDESLIFDPNMDYRFLTDSKLKKMLDKDIADREVTIDNVYTTNVASGTKILQERLYVSSIHFKNINVLKRYQKFFSKHFKKDYPVIFSSYVDDPINHRVNKISSLRDNITISIGEIHNHSKNYEIIFNWDRVDDDDLYQDIITEIQNGGFYTDTPVSIKTPKKLENHYIYIDEERFVNKIKIVKKWQHCIKEIIVNNEGSV